VQASGRGNSHETAFVNIALPVTIANQTTLTECATPGQNSIASLGADFAQNQRPCPSKGGVPERISGAEFKPGCHFVSAQTAIKPMAARAKITLNHTFL